MPRRRRSESVQPGLLHPPENAATLYEVNSSSRAVVHIDRPFSLAKNPPRCPIETTRCGAEQKLVPRRTGKPHADSSQNGRKACREPSTCRSADFAAGGCRLILAARGPISLSVLVSHVSKRTPRAKCGKRRARSTGRLQLRRMTVSNDKCSWRASSNSCRGRETNFVRRSQR